MKNTLIDANGKGNADLTIRADNQSKNLNMGGIMSAATSDFNVGLGAVWNRLRQNTVAEFAFDKPSNKTSTVGNFNMQAVNYSSINSWAGGGTAAYQTLFDATGSFVSNYIGLKNGGGLSKSTSR